MYGFFFFFVLLFLSFLRIWILNSCGAVIYLNIRLMNRFVMITFHTNSILKFISAVSIIAKHNVSWKMCGSANELIRTILQKGMPTNKNKASKSTGAQYNVYQFCVVGWPIRWNRNWSQQIIGKLINRIENETKVGGLTDKENRPGERKNEKKRATFLSISSFLLQMR